MLAASSVSSYNNPFLAAQHSESRHLLLESLSIRLYMSVRHTCDPRQRVRDIEIMHCTIR